MIRLSPERVPAICGCVGREAPRPTSDMMEGTTNFCCLQVSDLASEAILHQSAHSGNAAMASRNAACATAG
jgi:hypothetical protein